MFHGEFKEELKDYKKSDPSYYLWLRVKGNAKHKGQEFTISPEDIVIPKICPILGIPLYFTEGSHTNNTPSVDRIDNGKGYLKGNIQVISYKANRLKSNLTREQLLKYAFWIYKTYLKKEE